MNDSSQRERIVVAHLGGQHATHLAEALAARGMLLAFATGICASRGERDEGPARRLGVRRLRIATRVLSRSWVIGAFAMVPQRLIPARARMYWNHQLAWQFGKRCVGTDALSRADVVVGFENSAASLFERARSVNPRARRVLECPSVHHSAQSYGALPPSGQRFVARINAIKDAEIALADHIVVLSSMARDTFVAAGVRADKVHVIPMGVDTRFFHRSQMPATSEGLRFLFVGAATYTKGIDTLVEAFRSVAEPNASLRIAGVRTPLLAELAGGDPRISVLGTMPHRALREEYAAAHVLVLPSRFDGFGLVVTEAMATGRPVIVSSKVGAADLVATADPTASGWIVPAGDAPALAAAMRAAIAAGERLARMGAAARATVEAYSWDAYGESVAAYYGSLARKARAS